MHPVEITDANFEQEVIKSDLPVLIDFWAVWCGPCKAIAPIVTELAAEYDGKLKVGKIDIDNNQEVSVKYGIRSIPTLLLFKDGKIVDQIVGAVPKAQIVAKIAPHITETVS
jgi:thioredoxin 1